MNKAQPSENILDYCYRMLIRLMVVALMLGGFPETAATQEHAEDAARRGADLAKRVLQEQESSGFLIRARAVIGEDPDDPALSSVLQVRIVGRREKHVARVLYQILWPNSRKGQALVLERSQDLQVSGFLFFPPDRVMPLTDSLMTTTFAGTGLTIEDLAEDFWRWPIQRIVGQGRAGKRGCAILESHPSPETVSAYAMVRSCIARNSPLWIEKLSESGNTVKRISFETYDGKKQDRDYGSAMIVEGDSKSLRTQVEFLKSERGIKISPDEFSVESLKAIAAAKQ
jgi:hypothetical protein